MRTLNAAFGLLLLLTLNGCTPRIEVAAPKEPITINMNVKIEHDINIKADKEVEALLRDRQ
ncbi:YnbE family lipoprotein [Pseudescherichia sp.]|uniref:YnbE family lipoprotein n=1 Tax=Pseudescherichia sp. TaxID=2055881 RepID=UPI0028986FD2|nr:YnbE family lipoprotein [Pseudescherichia sp.]